MTRAPEHANQSRVIKDHHAAGGVPPAMETAFEEWLRCSGVPQVALYRCACQCRFRWPADAQRVKADLSTGAVGRVVELARCPACRAACLRVPEGVDSPTSFFLSKDDASVDQTREGAVSSLAAALVKTSGGDISREEDWAPALHAARHTVDAIADFVLSTQRASDASTWDVVQRLRADGSAALLDILKLDRSLEGAVQHLALLAVASSELQALAQSIGLPSRGEDRKSVTEVHERANRVGVYAAEVLLQLCGLRREVLGWNLTPRQSNGGPRS